MEQSATALAVPAANRKSVRIPWLTCLCVLALQVGIASAHADEVSAGFDKMPDYVRYALLEKTDVSKAGFYYSPMLATPVLKPDTKKTVSANPQSKPALKQPELKQKARLGAQRSSQRPTLLFGSLGKSSSLTPVTARWTRALSEHQMDNQGSDSGRHTFRAYSAILDKVRNEPRRLQIPKINYMVNRLLKYREDIRLWKTGEYWASPVETLSRRAGDCEDYSILKYALLRDLGVKDEDMRIVVLRDTAARQYHAVLSVRHEGKWLILDNRFSRVRFERDLPHYQALYSVNASGQWSHTPKGGSPVRLAARLKSATR
jgi:predicted transglutaminase-like cysteine proteinase